jgi:hypothetical protein
MEFKTLSPRSKLCLIYSEGLEARGPAFVQRWLYMLKARIVEPEKQSLLASGSETTSSARQQILNKQVY